MSGFVVDFGFCLGEVIEGIADPAFLPCKIRPRNADGADFRGFLNLNRSAAIESDPRLNRLQRKQ
jgi:hypothetical protein